MKIKDEAAWALYKERNSDSAYGKGILNFAEAWATAMDVEIDKGRLLNDAMLREVLRKVWEKDAVTGFMETSAAVALLHVWEHGIPFYLWYREVYLGDTNFSKTNTQWKALLSGNLPIAP